MINNYLPEEDDVLTDDTSDTIDFPIDDEEESKEKDLAAEEPDDFDEDLDEDIEQ